jgi:nucleoside-diphosphate-sugar epimerase
VGGGHDVAISDNLIINTNVLRAAVENHVERIAFASSGCVYPVGWQMNEVLNFKIPESWITHDEYTLDYPDGMYGTTKLMHEKVLGAYHRDGLIRAAICRFFTVFGPRMKENHFICASIAKSFIKQDPFYVWGSPDIVRNFTPVQNTVQGFLLAVEKSNGEPYNIGLEERISIDWALEKIWELMNWRPKEVIYQPDKPVGIRNRVSDCTKAREELGWKPEVTFEQGLVETIDWYVQTHRVEDVRENLERQLTER